MKIGITEPFHNPLDERGDGEVIATGLRCALLAEDLGFDSMWTVEHHFGDYCISPDPLQTLSYLAGKTERVEIGTMVIVMPWWKDPVRVAEKVIHLDHISDGRFILGVGRGAAKSEFDGFSIPMRETRQRFIESTRMVLDGLETGFCESDGELINQPRVALRPKPLRSFKGRRFGAAVSPESRDIMAELGLGMLIIPQKPWDDITEDVRHHRDIYVATHGEEPPPCVTSTTIFCGETEAECKDVIKTWLASQVQNQTRHYGTFDKKVEGYESYYVDPKAQQAIPDWSQLERVLVGTPDVITSRMLKIQESCGTDHFSGVFHFAGMPEEMAERSIRLFAREVMPTLKALPEPTLSVA